MVAITLQLLQGDQLPSIFKPAVELEKIGSGPARPILNYCYYRYFARSI
jgi:hypothetical protein